MSGWSSGASGFNCYSRWCRRRLYWGWLPSRQQCKSGGQPFTAKFPVRTGIVWVGPPLLIIRQTRLSIAARSPPLSQDAAEGIVVDDGAGKNMVKMSFYH